MKITCYKKDLDYTISKVKNEAKEGKYGNNKIVQIFLTPELLCQSTKSSKGEEIRKYFIEIEYVLYQYQAYIIEGLSEKKKQLEKNQKPKINTERIIN